MKRCSKCDIEKDESQFYRKNKKRLQSMCKECFNEYCIERWKKRKKEAINYMGGVCSDCNNSFHPAAFEFHHLNPSKKEYQWDKMRLISKDKMYTELDKCVMLCANCHRIRHADE